MRSCSYVSFSVWFIKLSIMSSRFISFPLGFFCIFILWIELQWPLSCWYLFEILISFPLNMYSEVALLDQTEVFFFNFLRSLHSMFYNGWTKLYYHQLCKRVPSLFSTSWPTLTFCLFNNSHSNRWEVIAHCGFDLPFPDFTGVIYLLIVIELLELLLYFGS